VRRFTELAHPQARPDVVGEPPSVDLLPPLVAFTPRAVQGRLGIGAVAAHGLERVPQHLRRVAGGAEPLAGDRNPASMIEDWRVARDPKAEVVVGGAVERFGESAGALDRVTAEDRHRRRPDQIGLEEGRVMSGAHQRDVPRGAHAAVRSRQQSTAIRHRAARVRRERAHARVDRAVQQPVAGAEEDHELAGRGLQSVVLRRGEAARRLPHERDVEPARDRRRSVGRAIVDDDDLQARRARDDASHCGRQHVRLVAARDDDRHEWTRIT